MADLHLVLQKSAAGDLVMPSKLTAILAVGGCALVTADLGTSLYKIVRENKMGLLVEPENADALEHAITLGLNSDLSEYRENARRYAVRNLEKGIIMEEFELFLRMKVSAK